MRKYAIFVFKALFSENLVFVYNARLLEGACLLGRSEYVNKEEGINQGAKGVKSVIESSISGEFYKRLINEEEKICERSGRHTKKKQ